VNASSTAAAKAAPAKAGKAAAAAAAATAMDLADQYPELDSGLKLIKNNEPQLAAYLSDPDVECTFFAPTNQVRAVQGKLQAAAVE
jgi:hypothetical protein